MDAAYSLNSPYSAANSAEALESPPDTVRRAVSRSEWFGISMYYYLSGSLGRGACCKIDRTFQGDGSAIGAKAPSIAIGLNKQCAHIIARQRGFDTRVQVEPDRERPAYLNVFGWAVRDGPEERVLAPQVAAICRQKNAPPM